MDFIDPVSGLTVGEPFADPFAGLPPFTEALSPEDLGLILSASGWRGVFAASDEDPSSTIRPAMRPAALAMAVAAGEFFRARGSHSEPVLLGLDARPTGPALADIFLRTFSAMGLPWQYLFITPAPEIMSAATVAGKFRGFCYLSASHNPVGHNGVKLGLADGGVIPAATAAPLIRRVGELLKDPAALQGMRERCAAVDGNRLAAGYREVPAAKREASAAYYAFSTAVVFEESDAAAEALSRSVAESPIGVVAELNGSARSLSIDAEFLSALGCRSRFFNARPREIRHAILPEGEALHPCRDLLEQAWREDPAFELGYVPDNDGDRGNIVYIDPADGRGYPLEAQQVFSLSLLAELAYRRLAAPEDPTPEAVVVNGPTSLRVEAIASRFGVEVHRAEVGEANVVSLARDLRGRGYRVRLLGEGSNGGTITYPASVRDPLNTLCALIKLLRFRAADGRTPADVWRGITGAEGNGVSIASLLSSLPAYMTTPTGEQRAVYPVRTRNHGALKTAYEDVLSANWPQRDSVIRELGIESFGFVNYEGTQTRRGAGNRTGAGRGGFKVELLDDEKQPIAFLWMRGSGTEPVFRVMVDCPGKDPRLELRLLDWHRSLLEEADERAARGE